MREALFTLAAKFWAMFVCCLLSQILVIFRKGIFTGVRGSVRDETFLTGNGVLKTTCYTFLNNILQISGVGTPSDWVFDHPLIYIAFGPHSLYQRAKIRVSSLWKRVIDQIIMLPPKKFRKILNFETQGGPQPKFYHTPCVRTKRVQISHFGAVYTSFWPDLIGKDTVWVEIRCGPPCKNFHLWYFIGWIP